MAVRSDWPQLVEIMNKTLDNIPHEQMAAIMKRWANLRIERAMNWMLVLQIGGVAAVFLGSLLAWLF